MSTLLRSLEFETVAILKSGEKNCCCRLARRNMNYQRRLAGQRAGVSFLVELVETYTKLLAGIKMARSMPFFVKRSTQWHSASKLTNDTRLKAKRPSQELIHLTT